MNMKFEIQPAANRTSDEERAAKLVDPGFGRVFSDHMAIVRYSQGKGWHDARVESRANFPLDPATAVLHYAQEIFEGLKAYERDDGGVNLFRPDANAKRFRHSAERMAMMPLPEPVFIEAVEQLVRIDRGWIPGGEGSLYLRPFMIASEVFLGVKPSAEYIFAIIASPVGSYFKGGPGAGLDLGFGELSRAPRSAAPARSSVGAIMPRACARRPRRLTAAAIRWCSSTRSSAATSRNSAA